MIKIKNNISKINKIIFIYIFAIAYILLVSCTITNKNNVRLPDLTNLNREQITNKLNSLNITFQFKVESGLYLDESLYDKFVKYAYSYESGDLIDRSETILIYTTPLNLPASRIDETKMDFSYQNKNFLKDGVGEVTLARNIDGDTAHFYCDGEYIKVLFLGINTPESTYDKEAWGKAASNYTNEILNNAKSIVLERSDSLKDTYGRYLAYVWVDGKLLNQLIVENAYSNCRLSKKDKYFNIMSDIEFEVMKTGRRVYGEVDPNYDYEKKEFK